MMAPGRAEQFLIAFAIQRVNVVPLFPTGQRTSVVFAAHLPAAGVAAEERDVAAIRNVLFKTVTHPGGPIFVVADTQYEAILFQDLRMKFQVAVDGIVDHVAVGLGPFDKG